MPVVGAFVPAQLFLFGGGILARLGHLALLPLVLVGFAAAAASDLLAYGLGHRYGTHVFDRLPLPVRRHADSLRAGLCAHLGKSLVVGRWLGAARALAPPLAGASRIGLRRFVPWSLLSSALWSVGAVAIGYFFADGYARVQHELGRAALVLALVAGAAAIAYHRYRLALRQASVDDAAGR